MDSGTTNSFNKYPFTICITLLACLGRLGPFGILVVAVIVALVCYFCGSWILNLVQTIIFLCNWVSYLMSKAVYVIIAALATVVLIIPIHQYWRKSKIAAEKAQLYDECVANRTSPEDSYRVTEIEDDCNNNTKEIIQETIPEIEPVNKECNFCGHGVVMEEEKVSRKSYRMRRSEKKKNGMTMMECEMTKSERVRKTASWKPERVDGDGLRSIEEYCMRVDTFITEGKKERFWQNCGVDQRQNGGGYMYHNGCVDQRQNCGYDMRQNISVEQWQNDVVQWQNGVPQLQNSVPQWQNGVPQLQNNVPQWQNGAVEQWQNGVPQLQNGAGSWQGWPDDRSGRGRSRR